MSKKRVIDALASSIKNYHEYVGGNEVKKNVTKKRVFDQGVFYTKFQNYFMKFLPYSNEKSNKVKPKEYKDNSKYLRDNSNKYYNIEKELLLEKFGNSYCTYSDINITRWILLIFIIFLYFLFKYINLKSNGCVINLYELFFGNCIQKN